MKKAQFAMEFISLIAIMFIIFVGISAFLTQKILDIKEDERKQIAEDIATLALNEIELAQSASSGYFRTFKMPVKVNGLNYTMTVIDNRELIINYTDQEHVTFLPNSVSGNLYRGDNNITKQSGTVYLNP